MRDQFAAASADAGSRFAAASADAGSRFAAAFSNQSVGAVDLAIRNANARIQAAARAKLDLLA